MASNNPKRKRPQGERKRYDNVRNTIQDGDVLLFQGLSPISQLIRFTTKSAYSHAGMAFWWDKRLFVLHSVGSGVVCWPVSRAVGEYHGRVDWFRLQPEALPQLNVATLRERAQISLGLPYSTRGLFEFAWRLLTRSIGRRDLGENPKRLFCSEYVSYCYRCAGVDLWPQGADSETSPANLAASPLLEFIATLDPHGL